MDGDIHTTVTAMVGVGVTRHIVGDIRVMAGGTQDMVGATLHTVGATRDTVGAITHLIMQDIMKGPLMGNDMQIIAVE